MTDWMDYYCDFSSQDIGNRALALYQSHRSDRNACETLLDEFFCGPEYVATIEAVRNAVSEESEMVSGVECIGSLTKGIWDNLMDLSNTWALYPHRRGEFGRREMQDLRDAQRLLNDLMDKIEQKRESDIAA
jgi:hypothetical protein